MKKKAKRAPRRKWWEVAEGTPPSAALAELMEKYPGKFSDFEHEGVPRGPKYDPWFDAFHDVDRFRDQRAFVALIRPFIPEPVRPYYDDFFQRNEIRTARREGRPATPLYDRSARDQWIELAIERTRDLVKEMSVKDALEKARKFPAFGIIIPFTTLKDEYEGRGKKPPHRRKKPRSAKSSGL